MPERVRFHLDENISTQVARSLRQHGCDATMPRDAGLLKAHDPQHLAFARTTGHVLVTHDADLLRMANRGVPHMGIAYCAPRSRTTSEIVRTLLLIYEVLTPDEMANHIEFL